MEKIGELREANSVVEGGERSAREFATEIDTELHCPFCGNRAMSCGSGSKQTECRSASKRAVAMANLLIRLTAATLMIPNRR